MLHSHAMLQKSTMYKIVCKSAQKISVMARRRRTFYICGDASRMAKDVHQTLIDIVAQEGNMNASDAKATSKMSKDKRYQKDIY